MKFKIIVLALLSVALLFGIELKYYGGGKQTADRLTLDRGNFSIDGAKVDKGKISEIVFSHQTAAGITPAEAPTEQFDADMLIAIADSLEAQYPDAAGLILFDHGEQVLRSDGTRVYRYHFAGKILKSSRLGWGTRILYIDEGRRNSKVLFARTIPPERDKTIIYADTSKATITPVTRDNVSFGHGMIYTLQFPGVQEGSIVEYMYEVDTYNPDDTARYSTSWYFQDEDPVYSSQTIVRLPKPKELYYIFKNPPGALGSVLYLGTPDLTEKCFQDGKLPMEGFIPEQWVYADTSLGRWFKNSMESIKNAEPEIVDEDTSTAYIWHLMNIPPLVSEPRMPDYGDVIPHLEGSIFKNWDYLFNWLGDLQKARIKPTPEIEDKVKEIIAGAKTIDEKIGKIYLWVQRNIQYISIKGSVSSGQTGHPAAETFKNGYGDCTDKSILFCTMLNAIGIEAHPIIIMTNSSESVDRCIPSLDGNHAIARIIMPDGRELFLDPTAYADKFPYFRSDDQGVSFVDAIGKEIGMTSTNTPEQNSEEVDVDMDIDANGNAVAEFKSLPIGMREGDYRSWWEYQQADRYKQIFANWMSGIFPQASLDTFALIGIGSLDSQLVEWAKVSVDSFPAIAGDMWVFTIPGVARSMRGFDEINLDERKFDIEYTAPRQNKYSVKIHLPKKAKIIALPDDVELSCEPYADFSLKFEKSGRNIIVEQNFRLKKRIVPISDFERYKRFIISAKQSIEKRAFVRRPK